jgi:Rrf2 family protein
MKLSKRGEYSLRALIDLGVAAELGRPIVQVSELAAKERLPTKFLEQIFIQLKAGGYVTTTRGKNGGYSLAKPARRIKFGQVIRLIEGPLAPIPCVSVTAYGRCTCPDEAHCGLRMLMLDVRNAISRVLDRYTLAETVAITLRKLRRDGLKSPFISPARSLPQLPAELQALTTDDAAFAFVKSEGEVRAATPRRRNIRTTPTRRSRGQ